MSGECTGNVTLSFCPDRPVEPQTKKKTPKAQKHAKDAKESAHVLARRFANTPSYRVSHEGVGVFCALCVLLRPFASLAFSVRVEGHQIGHPPSYNSLF